MYFFVYDQKLQGYSTYLRTGSLWYSPLKTYDNGFLGLNRPLSDRMKDHGCSTSCPSLDQAQKLPKEPD
jgi:hypothetical protein